MNILKTLDRLRELNNSANKSLDKILCEGTINFSVEYRLYNNSFYRGFIIVFDDDCEFNQFELHGITLQDLAEFDEGYTLDYTVNYEDRDWSAIAYHYAGANRNEWKSVQP